MLVLAHIPIAILCLITLIGAPEASSAMLNLPNGGFEQGNTSGWTVYNPDSQALSWNTTNNADHIYEGSYAAALTAFGGTESLLILHNGVSVATQPAGSLLKVRLCIKTENLQLANPNQGLRFVVAIWNASSQVLAYHYANGDYAGTHEYMPVEIVSALPQGATRADIQMVLNTGIVSGAACLDSVSMEIMDTPGELSADIPHAEIKRDRNGSPRLYINGNVQTPDFFFGNSGNPAVYEEAALAASAGVNLVQIPINLPWEGMSTGMADLLLQANPNAWILPRISIFPSAVWKTNHADQLFVDENGGQTSYAAGPSLASDIFITDAKAQIESLVRFFHNTPYKDRIIGYHLTYLSGGEWFYPEIASSFWDYSEVNRLRYVAWLEKRYGSIENLNTAWRTSYAAFNAISIPSAAEWQKGDDGFFRDPAKQRAVPDYCEYHNNLVADRIAELAAFVKQLTSHKSLVAAFYGYQTELINNGYTRGIAHSGHLALRRLLESPDIDILCSPVSYFDRQIGGPCNMMSMVDSVALSGKMYLQENDSNTYVVNPSGNPDNFNPWYSTEWDTMQCLRRDYGNVIAHNQALWWMDLWADGRFNSPSIWSNNAVVSETYKDSIDAAMAYKPSVALIYDEETYYWLKSGCNALTQPNAYAQRSVFQESGVPVGYYHIQDLPNIPSSVKLYVFVNTFRMAANERALVEGAKNNGHTLVWLYAPGYVNETGLSLADMQDITGFPLLKNAAPANTTITMAAGVSPIAQGLAGHAFGSASTIAPSFYGDSTKGGFTTLGTYSGNGLPALLLQENNEWNSVFCGAPSLSAPLVRSLARYAGINLLVDAGTLSTADAANYNGRYLYVYARERGGRRCFQIPGEKAPNGGFEKFTGALPTSGFGCWISPSYGALPVCTATSALAHTGANALQTGPFTSTPGQYSEPLGITLQAEQGKTYHVSGSVYIDGLDASAAGASDYIYLVFQPHEWSTASYTAVLATGTASPLQDKSWTSFSGDFTFSNTAADYTNELRVLLKVYGTYAATNIAFDDISILEDGASPVDVVDVTANALIGTAITSWSADFEQNEQRIFKLTGGEGPGPPLLISTNYGQDFTTGISPFTLEGACETGMAELDVNGVRYAHPPNETEWRIELPLILGQNMLHITALDASGAEIGSADITITYNPTHDADGDGVPDAVEIALGTDPYNADSVPQAPMRAAILPVLMAGFACLMRERLFS